MYIPIRDQKMNRVLILFFGLVYCSRGDFFTPRINVNRTPITMPTYDSDADEEVVNVPTAYYPSTTTSTTTLPAATDELDDISMQDILSSDIDASDKIEKKIINAISEFSSNCDIYKQVELSLNGFVFPKNTINVDLGVGNAAFYNFTIKEESDATDNKRKSYSTLIGCDSSKEAKVEVTLPSNIKITANVKINEIMDPSLSKLASEGSITIIFKNNSIAKQFTFQHNGSKFEKNITRKISYYKTDVSLDLDTKYQKAIYNNLGAFLSELKSPLEEFFVDAMNFELAKNNISVGQSCSKFINMETNSKKINSIFLKNDFNNLYVISNVSLETWKGVNLSVGPIVIQGLSHFNSTELIVSGTELSSPESNGYFRSTPRSDDPEKKQITVRIKTNGLKGKLDWAYNLKQRSFSFFVDFVTFEVIKSKSYSYAEKLRYDYYDPVYYNRSVKDKINIEMYFGNIRIKSSKSGDCENEKEFVNFVLSEYLKTVLKESLKNSLSTKIQNNLSVVNC